VKILVTAKRVTDPDMKIKVKPDGSGIVTDSMNYKVNPFCEIAIEEAVRIKEKGDAEVVVVAIGSKEGSMEIRQGLAMGADRGIHIVTDEMPDPAGIAVVLSKIVEEEKPDLILTGKQAVDDDSNQASQILAELLNIPQACFASIIEMKDQRAVVTREVDGGLEVVDVALPAVITADLRLNEPRYPSLPNIMKAKRKPIDERNLSDMGLDLAPRTKIVKMAPPPERQGGVQVEDVPSLVAKLKDEAKVI